MSEWLDVHVDTLMNNTSNCRGQTILGFEHYLKLFLENQEIIIQLLRQIKE